MPARNRASGMAAVDLRRLDRRMAQQPCHQIQVMRGRVCRRGVPVAEAVRAVPFWQQTAYMLAHVAFLDMALPPAREQPTAARLYGFGQIVGQRYYALFIALAAHYQRLAQQIVHDIPQVHARYLTAP